MAKRRSIGQDRFINRWRGLHTVGTGAFAIDTINTGMNVGQAGSYKWVITHFSMQPNGVANAPIGLAADASIHFQLCVGVPTALLNGDDPQLIAEMSRDFILATNGIAYEQWPIYGGLPAPVPCFGAQLSICSQATNEAAYNTKVYTYEIGYITAPAGDREIIEYIGAYGQA